MSDYVGNDIRLKSTGTECGRKQHPWFVLGVVLLLSLVLLGAMWRTVHAAPAAPPRVDRLSVSAPSAVPGEEVQYTISFRVRTPSPNNGTITFTMANQLVATGASARTYAIPSWSGNVVTWTVPDTFPATTVNFTVTAQAPATDNILGELLPYVAEVYLCNDNECVFRSSTGSNAIIGPDISKQNTTSIIMSPSNGEHQAVAGETVTITAQFAIPDGTVAYSVTPRIVLQDGLVPVSSDPAWTTVITGVRADLDTRTTLDGYQLEYAVSPEITQAMTLTYTIQAIRMQNTDPDIKPSVEIAHNSRLKIHPVLRWCDAPGCVIDEASDAPYSAVNTVDNDTVSVIAINPLVNTTIAHAFTGADGLGGDAVRLTYSHTGAGTVAAPRPTAYDAIFTATLGGGLVVDMAEPMYDGIFQVGHTTVLTWVVPEDLIFGVFWTPVVTASLSTPWVAGQTFTTTSQISYDTYAGTFPHEGVYVTDADYTYAAEVRNIKTSIPVANTEVTMGDVVTYYVRLEVGANVSLPAFHYTDTLPVGFQLLTPVTVTGGTLRNQQTAAGLAFAGGIKTALGWSMDALPADSSGYVITSTYTVVNSGLDYEGQPVYVTRADMVNVRSDKNSVTMYWGDSDSDGPHEVAIRVIQPHMGDTFNIVRTDPGPRDVGFSADYEITFRNTGRSPAYDVQICDTLPEGVQFWLNKNNPPNLVSSPSSGASGEICWQFSSLANGVTSSIQYAVLVTDGAMPGVGLDSFAEVANFSSKPDVVPYERYYADIEAAVAEKWCADCLWVLGFEADKTVLQSDTLPGQYITYTIVYSNSSNIYTYTNAFITDIYDANLIFVNADPSAVHNPGVRELRWDLEDLELDAYGEIVVTMRVQDVITDGATTVVNTLIWDSDNSQPHQRQTVTPLGLASMEMDLAGPARAHAGQTILYTVTYTNTGTASAPVTITLNYGPDVGFVTATPAPVQGDNVFSDTVPNDGVGKSIQITLQVKAPLPYTLEQFGATAKLETPGLLDLTDALVVELDRPIIILDKVAPVLASPPGPPNNRMSYAIHVNNNGTYTATGVVLTDTWGLNTDYVSDNHNNYGWVEPAPGAGYVTRTLNLGVGESATFTFLVAVTETASFYTNTVDMTTDQTTFQSDTAMAWSASVATSKSATPIPAFPGRVLTYTIYYTNTNTTAGAFTNVRITDTLPTSFTYQDYETFGTACPSGWTFTAPVGSGGEAVWSCASLNNNSSGHFLIRGMVAESAEGDDLVNVTISSGDGIAVRPIETPLITRVARPWLRVDKTANPTHPVAPGDLITYTLTYENYGADPAYNVIIKDQLPAQVTYGSCSGGDSCGQSSGLVTWNLVEVPVDTVGTVQVVVQVKAGTGGQTAVNANYTIQSNRLSTAETESGPAISTQILNPHISVTKVATPEEVTLVNAPITYTIAYVNDGGGTLTNITISDELSTKTSFSAVSSGCQGPGSGVGGTVTCALGDLAQGETGSVQIVVLAAGEGLITNTAVINSAQTAPLETTPPTEVYYSAGGCFPPYNVDFTVSQNPRAGEAITFTASASGDAPHTYAWTFGDTQSGSGQAVNHTYAVSGTYTVNLNVSNTCYPSGVNVQKIIEVPGAPEIAWTPASFAKSADEGSTTILQDTLTVSNEGTDDLLWSIEVMTPTAATWLKISTSGPPGTALLSDLSTAPSANTPVTVYFDPTGLTAGVYTAQLRIVSNDADEGVVLVPVTFTIRASDEDYYIYLPLVLRNH